MPAAPATSQRPTVSPQPCPDAAEWLVGRWRFHVGVLCVSAAILTAAIMLNIGNSQHVVAPLYGEMPPMCAWKKAFSVNCPGCGLTRSFVAFGHGDVVAAWKYNPAGLLMFALVLYQFPFRGRQLWVLWHGRPDYRHGPWTVQIVIWIVVFVLIAQWVVRFAL